MATPITRILRSSRRRPGDPLNVLIEPGPSDADIAAAGHRTFPLGEPLPIDVSIDVVVTQTSGPPFDDAAMFASRMCVPHLSVQHESPGPDWGPDTLAMMAARRGDFHAFGGGEVARLWGTPGFPLPPSPAAWSELLAAIDGAYLTRQP